MSMKKFILKIAIFIQIILAFLVLVPTTAFADGGTALTPADFDYSSEFFLLRWFKIIFTPRYFEPHWEHFIFDPALMWSIIFSNFLVFVSYTLIPIALIYFIRKRKDLIFSRVFWLFGAFIILCGLHHLVHIITFWYPIYHLQNIVDILTGIVSLATFFALVKVIPIGLKLKSPEELRKINEELETQKKELIKQVAETKKFKLAVEASQDAIVITNPEYKIIYVNKAWEELNSLTFDEAKQQHPKKLLTGSEDEGTFLPIQSSIKNGEIYISEDATYKRKDGTEYQARLAVYPVSEQEKIVFLVFVYHDITKRKKIDRMKNDFVALASHQLRTPLTGVRWNIELLLEGELSAEQKELAEEAEQTSQRMANLVNDLLDLSKMGSGDLELEPKLTDLKDLINQVEEEVRPLVKEKQHKLNIDIETQLPKISLDPKLIHNVLVNLISNAIKYTEKFGLVELAVSRQQDQIFVRVSDNGVGIPEIDQEQIFDKFYRGENVVNLNVDGTGLGLYWNKQIIEASGGKIWFESKLGKGTTFWFSLPIKD